MKRLIPFFAVVLVIMVFTGPSFAKGKVVSGPMQGHTTAQSMKIWVMVKKAEVVSLTLTNSATGVEHSQTISTDTLDGIGRTHPMTFELTGLQANSTYGVSMVLDKKKIADLNEFSTFGEEKDKNFSFMIGSCALTPILPLKPINPGKEIKIYEPMTKTEADFMLWLGDYLYYFPRDYGSYYGMMRKHMKKRRYKAIDEFLSSKAQYSIWDDHDYGPNDSYCDFELKHHSLEIFKQFWPNPSYGSNSTGGNYTRFKVHDSEFFLLDDRFFRTPEKAEDACVLGDEQMQWLKQSLKESDARFKFIAIGSQVLNRASNFEVFIKYPDEQQELWQFLDEEQIEGVVFLSGDRHFTELSKIDRADAYPIYDVTCSPISSFPRRVPENNEDRVSGTFVNYQNYGRITVRGEGINREAYIEIFDINQKLLWDYTIKYKNLTYPVSSAGH